MIARVITLDDWIGVKEAWAKFKAGPYAEVIDGGDNLVQQMFLASLMPGSPILMLGVFDNDPIPDCYALGSVQAFEEPVVSADGLRLEMEGYTYIRSVFSLMPASQSRYLFEMLQLVVDWAKARGHKSIRGNCRLEFPERLAKRYGFYPRHTTFYKRLEV